MNVKKTTVRLTVMAMLIGLEIVLSRFLSIPTSITKIGFAFVPVAAAALLLGPLAAGAVGALGDLLGALLFPIGAYFPGFTLTAFLMGLCYGLFLYKDAAFWRVIAAVGVHQFVLSMLLNSLWLWIISTSADNSAFVYKQAEDGSMTEQPVTVGVSNGNYVEIRSGVSEGETVYAVVKQEEESTLGGILSGIFGSRQVNQPSGGNGGNRNNWTPGGGGTGTPGNRNRGN